MKHAPYLSICIPTFNRQDILHQTLLSIYSDIDGIELDDFEVVISDNEPNQSSRDTASQFNYENLHYHATQSNGFLNSYDVLKLGQGQFLKLHNNYTKLRPGTLKRLIAEIKQSVDEKPFIFYTNGLRNRGVVRSYSSFDSFCYHLSYFSSWSSGFGIWKEDFDQINDTITIDQYFPQTSLLLTQVAKSSYIINDLPIFENQSVPKKGGYNIFKVFAVDFLSLIETAYLKKNITIETYEKIKKDLILDYLSVRYFKTVIAKIDRFERKDIKKSIDSYYSSYMYYLMILTSFFAPFKHSFIKLRGVYFVRNIENV